MKPLELPDFTAIDNFRTTLSTEDQDILDDLLVRYDQFALAARHSGQPIPSQVMLLALLIEQHKDISRLQQQIDALSRRIKRQTPPARYNY